VLVSEFAMVDSSFHFAPQPGYEGFAGIIFRVFAGQLMVKLYLIAKDFAARQSNLRLTSLLTPFPVRKGA
jgi:hypothetical protein